MNNRSFAMLAVIASIILATTAFAQVYPEGMVSYWKFDEGLGSTASDSVGNNDGTLFNDPQWINGMVGQALSFDGMDDFVEVLHDASLNIAASNSFTLESWINLAKGGVSLLDKALNEPSNYRWIVGLAGQINDTRLGVWNGYGVRIAQTHFSLDEWHHVVTTFDGTNVRFYVDGVEQLSATPSPWNLSPANTGPLYIGRDCRGPQDNRFVHGIIDELALYNRVLADEEIAQHYENGLNGQGYEFPGAQLECIGFEPPMDTYPVPVKVKGKKRSLPMKAYLYDNGDMVTDQHISAPPVIQVMFQSATEGQAVDVTDEALAVNEETEGNQFFCTEEGKWRFNLKVDQKTWSAPGTYLIYMDTGDGTEYTIEPKCEASFVIE